MNENLLNVMYDPSLLPDTILVSAFEDVAISARTRSFYNCLHEEGLAKSTQKVGLTPLRAQFARTPVCIIHPCLTFMHHIDLY